MNTALLLEVVQGKKHWRELPTHGVDVRFYAGKWKFPPSIGEPLRPSLQDLVQGMRASLHDPAALAEWAQFILAASDFIELESLGDRGEQLQECLWDLSRGQVEKAVAMVASEK